MSGVVQSVFSYTGADQTYTVQPGVTSITVKMWGAGGGGNGNGKGGGGAYVEGTLAVTPGETLTIIVGSGGSRYNTSSNYGGGGGSATIRGLGGQGGGRSALRRGASEIVTAGGGGGGGSGNGGYGGGAATVTSQSFAGDVTLGSQVQSTAVQSSGSGGGGSTTAGGVNGPWPSARGSAVQFQGGTGGGDAESGGGGGGYWGGGGGSYAGGGGAGSSFLTNITNTTNSQSASREVPGNSSSTLRGTAGYGGTNDIGGNGLVVLEAPRIIPTPPQIDTQNSSLIPPQQRGPTTLFSYTGSAQTYTVPSGVTRLLVYLWGAGGGGGGVTNIGSYNGGAGAYVSGFLSTTPGESLRIVVGLGGSVDTQTAGTLDQGGGGGAGNPPNACSSGGGRSAIQRGVNNDIVVAGGGSGSGWVQGASATWFGPSNNGSSVNGLNGGGGGTQTAGGFAGPVSGQTPSTAGSKGQGGNGGGYASGGGGGWYGGGGGGVTGGNGGTGGAGSSYIDLLSNATGENGSVPGAPATTNLYYGGGAGAGGRVGSTTGGNGRIVIIPLLSGIPIQMRMTNLVPVTQYLTFFGTGTIQTWSVPPGVYSIRFFMWGAGGQTQNGTPDPIPASGVNSGSGAYIEGNITTTPGTNYQIIVGRPGIAGLANGAPGIGANTISGGGFSGLFSGTPDVTTVIAIAGGGGGSGYNGNGNGGGGGYPSGLAAANSGQGGTQTAGGDASASGGTAGSLLQGGAGVTGDNGGGGGGGGYFGGGGANLQRGGGGGSSTYSSSVFNPIPINGLNGAGFVDNTAPTLTANETSPYWVSPYGRTGRNGLVVIGYNPIPTTVTSLSYSGSYITYTVPSGVTNYLVYMWGAGGSGNNQGVNGGAGAFLSGIFSVTPGETLRIIVGKGGVAGGQNATDAQGGGGSSLGSSNSAQGGGRSAIQRFISGNYIDIVTVGGGGGAGYYGLTGGAGSYTTQGRRGGDQVYTTVNSGGLAGGGGSTTGGQGGYGKTASDGVQFRGGDVILPYGNPNGGGGGGGWYGGGGGSGGTPGEGGPGGGGSAYIANLINVTGQDSSGQPAPGTSSTFYPGGTIAAGGISNTQAGGNGYIALAPYSLLNPMNTFRFQSTSIVAFGGEVITTPQYRYHLFCNSGNFTINNTIPGMTLYYLLVGGGGGGGDRAGGGGGAGGVVSATFVARTGTFPIVVGQGGIAGNYETGTLTPLGVGQRGEDSSIGGIGIAFGGGGGGTLDGNPSGTFGSGGGGGGNNLSGVAGTAGQGFSGGNGLNPAGGGGGGAGGVGANANTSTGGIGVTAYSQHLLAVGYGTTFATSPNNPISGGLAYIGGGGGGGANASTLPTVRSGGLGGGGNGDWDDAFITAGTPNTGGGGGASRSSTVATTGRAGGSGLVLLWYSV